LHKVSSNKYKITNGGKLFEWLSPLIPFARHSENRRQWVDGKGVWLLQDPTFVNWSSVAPLSSVIVWEGAASERVVQGHHNGPVQRAEHIVATNTSLLVTKLSKFED
jgi:hypothetical protein